MKRATALVLLLIVIRRIVAALPALVFEAGAILSEDPEIMLRILQIIFALDAIARKLRVPRHVLVLFEKLRRIAALPVVLPVAPEVRASLAPAAASATALSIVDQMPTSLIVRSSFPPFPVSRGPRRAQLRFVLSVRALRFTNGRLHRG